MEKTKLLELVSSHSNILLRLLDRGRNFLSQSFLRLQRYFLKLLFQGDSEMLEVRGELPRVSMSTSLALSAGAEPRHSV